MKQRKKSRRWQRCAAAGMIGIAVLGGSRASAVNRSEGESFNGKQQTVEWVVRSAAGWLSPSIGWNWTLWKEGEEAVSELERLLLAEQRGQNIGEEAKWQETLGTEMAETVSPEDAEELRWGGIEWDDALLAEIDRENEAMRQQAEDAQQEENLDTMEMIGQALAVPYTTEQLNSMDFLAEYIYNINKSTTAGTSLLDAETLLSMDMKLTDPDREGPKILIHHTHATEYFADSNDKDEATLIVGVGDYLEELLETRYGIQVLHDRTVYPYNEAYSRALKHVEQILAENPSIEVFIDLHRDAGGTKKYTVNIDGKESANLMFFNGLSHTQDDPIDYLPNKNQQANLAFSFQMKMAGDSLYPGLCKRNYLKAYRYNLHVLPRAVIVEVGDNNNTLQEAKNAMEPLARILNYVLTGKY